jgi:hypothetical protein
MQTNLYGNRKALNQLNASNLAQNGEYVFAKPLLESKTIKGHFRIEYKVTKNPEFKKWKGSLSDDTFVDPAENAHIIEKEELTKEFESIGSVYDRWEAEGVEYEQRPKPELPWYIKLFNFIMRK